MTRRRVILLAATIISAGIALWEWKRPYDFRNTKESGYQIDFAFLKPEGTGVSLSLGLSKTDTRTLDLESKPGLITAAGRELSPSHIQMQGEPGNPMRHVDFRFTLTPSDFSGPIKLKVNAAELTVRRGEGLPDYGSSQTYTTSNW